MLLGRSTDASSIDVGPARQRPSETLILDIHFGQVFNSLIEGVDHRTVIRALRLLGCLYDGIMSRECLGIVFFGVKDGSFDKFKGCTGDGGDNLVTMFELCASPFYRVTEFVRVSIHDAFQCVDPHHGIANGGGVLTQLFEDDGIHECCCCC